MKGQLVFTCHQATKIKDQTWTCGGFKESRETQDYKAQQHHRMDQDKHVKFQKS